MENLFSMIRPELFDIFGLFTFTFLIFLAVWGLKTQKPLPRWSLVVLFVIGVLGILVDGVIVFVTYLS